MTIGGHPGGDPKNSRGPEDGGLGRLAELYRRYERQLYRQCRTHLGNAADAEDAVQATFLRAASHLDQLAEDAGPYLATVARNVCRDEMKRRARCIAVEDPALFGELSVGGPEPSSMDWAAVNAAWSVLSVREREMVGQRFAGFSYAEIAEQLGMTIGALKVALARARKRARDFAWPTITGILAAASLRRLLGRAAGRSARSAAGPAALPSLLAAGTAVACLVVGVAGGTWLTRNPTVGAYATHGTPTHGPTIAPAAPAGAAAAQARPDPHTAGASSVADAGLSQGNVLPTGGDVASGVLAPGQNSPQQDSSFSSMTASPNYRHDHVVFASGTAMNNCLRPSCPVLFSTHDGGASWHTLPATGFLGGTVLLPPTYPADPTIFVSGPAGIQRSDDGGKTFRLVLPVPGLNGFNAEVRAAVDPSSAPGDTRIIVATRTPLVLVYDSATGRTRAGPALPPGVIGVVDVAFAKDGDLLFAAWIPSQLHPGESDAAIVRCPGGTDCSVAFTAFDSEFAIVVSPTVSMDAAVVAWNTDSLYISRDSGATFTSMAVPSGGAITAVALSQTFATDGTMTVGLWPTSSSEPWRWRALTSDNGGAAFASQQDNGLRWIQVNAMLILPDGHELNAVETTSSPLFGIRCSLDGGRHWSLSC